MLRDIRHCEMKQHTQPSAPRNRMRSKLCEAPATNVAATSLCAALMLSDTASPGSSAKTFASAAGRQWDSQRTSMH